MSPKPDVSFIVLCFNDGPALPALLADLKRVLEGAAARYEILVVDDASTDDSLEILELLRREIPQVRVLSHLHNQGVGAGFRTGARAAQFDVVGYTDGDGQYVPDDIPALLAALEAKDAVSGIRVARADGPHRRVVTAVYRKFLAFLYGLELRDVNSGLKVYRRHFLQAAEPLSADGPFFDAEVMIKGLYAGFSVAELPIQHRPRAHGVSRGVQPSSVGRAVAGALTPQMARYRRKAFTVRLGVRIARLLRAPL